jgi:hypothetical protein
MRDGLNGSASWNWMKLLVQFRVLHHSGEYHWLDMRLNALRDAAGRIVKWFGMNINTTCRKSHDPVENRAEGTPPGNGSGPP